MDLGWATDSDIEPFLSQPKSIEDHLSPYMNLLINAKTDEEKRAVIWSISNLVPLQQFKPSEFKIVYYENFCNHPVKELPAIFASIGKTYTEPVFDTIDQPSQTTRGTGAIVAGIDKISNWKKRLNPSQIDNVLRFVEALGLGHLYGDSVLPIKILQPKVSPEAGSLDSRRKFQRSLYHFLLRLDMEDQNRAMTTIRGWSGSLSGDPMRCVQ